MMKMICFGRGRSIENMSVTLAPLQQSDRKQFMKDNQEAFNYDFVMEEFGLKDNHFEEDD